MLHHLSIAVEKPLRVAKVLAELVKGQAFACTVHPDSYLVVFGGSPTNPLTSTLEIYPLGTKIVPGHANEPRRLIHHISTFSSFTAVHTTISVPVSWTEIQAIARREKWRTLKCDRGGFQVIELWIEDWLMLELLPEELMADYLAFCQSKQIEHVFGPAIVSYAADSSPVPTHRALAVA